MRKFHSVLWSILRHNLILVLFVTFASVGTATILFSSGISGYSGNPATHSGHTCRDCHSGGTQPTVTMEGPTHTVTGRTYRFTLTISGGTQIGGGFDVSVTGGTLIASDAQTAIMNSEVVHSATRSADPTGKVSWFYDWTSPGSAGNTTMYGSGLSVNKDFGTGGDNDDKDQLSIQTEACDHLVLDVNPEKVAAGEKISFFTCGGVPSAPAILALVAVNGSPIFRAIL